MSQLKYARLVQIQRHRSASSWHAVLVLVLVRVWVWARIWLQARVRVVVLLAEVQRMVLVVLDLLELLVGVLVKMMLELLLVELLLAELLLAELLVPMPPIIPVLWERSWLRGTLVMLVLVLLISKARVEAVLVLEGVLQLH